ncbi:MAG: hypothetical protein M3R36_12310 [Bacteroidota bacterium]|nr:hypothetical protein [Bacteroidota bacterium]
MKILVYENSNYKKLYPLNLLRACYEIKCGANTILQRTESIIKNKFEISLHCRNILSAYLKEQYDSRVNSLSKDDHLLLNGRIIFTESSLKFLLSKKEENSYYVYRNEIIAAYISKDKSSFLKDKVENPDGENVFEDEFFINQNLKKIDLNNDFEICVINYSWDIIDYLLKGGLKKDFQYFFQNKVNKKLRTIIKKDNFIDHKKIFVSKNVKLFPEIILDASEGIIAIDENTTIEPFTYIKGPVYIGKNSLIKSGTKIYGPCVIGENSKVAGEIAESIFHSYVNKQHDGFAGHSYFCPFVNLGADTVTSDLKNNYSKIRMKIDNKNVNSGMQFLGSIIGDHSKTSINTMLNTGSNIGIFSIIFGEGFHDKEIQSFSWNEAGKDSEKYDIEKAIETAKIVMERRGIKMSESYEKLVRNYYKI